jgi:hypothetical protein
MLPVQSSPHSQRHANALLGCPYPRLRSAAAVLSIGVEVLVDGAAARDLTHGCCTVCYNYLAVILVMGRAQTTEATAALLCCCSLYWHPAILCCTAGLEPRSVAWAADGFHRARTGEVRHTTSFGCGIMRCEDRLVRGGGYVLVGMWACRVHGSLELKVLIHGQAGSASFDTHVPKCGHAQLMRRTCSMEEAQREGGLMA